MSKLLIFTSPNHDEWEKYWHKVDQGIVINGGLIENGTKKFITDFEWNSDKIESFITGKDAFILLHEYNSKSHEIKTKADGTKYTILYYSTLNPALVNVFWSFKESERWNIPKKMPSLPMDKLCWALNQPIRDESIIKKVCDDIIEFYKEKIIFTANLDTALNFLHECLTSQPSTLPEIVDEGYNFRINNREESLNTIFKIWKGPKDYDGLANLRDGLLAWALVK